MNKNILNKLNEALINGLEIRLHDTFDGTEYTIDDAYIEDGICFVEACVNGVDEDDDLNGLLEDEEEAIVDAIAAAQEELQGEGHFPGE